MIGVDTFDTDRWRHFGDYIEDTHHWLQQLLPEIADRISLKNARSLFRHSRSRVGMK